MLPDMLGVGYTPANLEVPMRHAVPLLLLSAACAPAESDWADLANWGGVPAEEGFDEALPGDVLPPPTFDVVVSQIIGGPARVSAAPLPAGTVVNWAVSTAGAGAGPCFPALGGECLDILSPYHLGSSVTDSNGLATAFLNRTNDGLSGVSVDVTNDNSGTFDCEQTSSCLANTASSTSNKSYFAFSESET